MRKILVLFLSSMLFAGIYVSKDETKRGDVVCMGDSVNIEGKVMGDLVSIGCKVNFSGKIHGDMVVIGGKVIAKQGGKVNGDMVLILSRGDVNKVKVRGDTIKILSSVNLKEVRAPIKKRSKIRIKIIPPSTHRNRIFSLNKFILDFILWGVLSLFVLLVAEKKVLLTSSVLEKSLGKSWIKGFLLFLLAIFLIITFAILSIVLIGIPFLLLTVFLIIAAALFGYTSVFHLIGRSILSSQTKSSVYYVLLGVTIFSFLKSFFIIGKIVTLIILPIAMGVTYITRFGKRVT